MSRQVSLHSTKSALDPGTAQRNSRPPRSLCAEPGTFSTPQTDITQ